MPTVLQDPVRPEHPLQAPTTEPLLSPAERAAPRPSRLRENLGQSRSVCAGDVVSFDLESHGGYQRTVTGTVAFLDREAETYMVLAPNGTLLRVPLRDIKATRGSRLIARGKSS
jgi:hypothetical protein